SLLLGAGVQHQPGAQRRPAAPVPGPARPSLERQARHRSARAGLVRRARRRHGRRERHPFLPRACREERHFRARRPHAAQQPGGGRRRAARAHHVPVHRRGREAQRRAGRLDRARASDRAHERRRHRAVRAASERGTAFLRLHALARGAAAPALARLCADPRQPALAARPAPLPADRPRPRHGRARQMAEVIRGCDRQAQRAMRIGTMQIGTAPIFLIALLALQTHAQTLPELALYSGPDRAQRLVEGAQKERTLLFYTTFPPEYANQLIEPFVRRYGIKVNYWRARSEIILSRALAEGRAGSATADVITTISPQLEALRREGLLQEVRSPYQQQHADFAIPA